MFYKCPAMEYNEGMENSFIYKIKNKIMLMILLASIPCLLYALYSSYRYYNYARNMIIEEKEALAEEMTQNLNFQLGYYENITLTTYFNETILDYINGGDYQEKNANVEAYLKGIVNSERNVEAVVLELGDTRYEDGYRYHNLEEYLDRHREEVLAKKGKVVWFPTETMSARYHSDLSTFALARAINSRDGTVGTLWMFFPAESISDFLRYRRLEQEGIDFYILADNRMIICCNRPGRDGTFIEEEDLPGEPLVVTRQSKTTKWYTTVVIDPQVVFGPVEELQRVIRILTFLSLPLLVLIYLYMTKTIFRPVQELSLGMKKVSGKEFEKIPIKPRAKAGHTDEMDMLMEHYNLMIDEIQRLMLEVREEEKAKNEEKMKALSMQISPHFVFNTLNTVRWMAISNKQTNIKRMIESLIALMKCVTYTKKEEITVSEEISLLDSYIYIQKMRFVNFEVCYQVEEDTKSLRMLKLLLQPLVENCILHAFSGRKQGGIIMIRIWQAEDVLQIRIQDNGAGFDPGELLDLKQERDPEGEHVGLSNVVQRICLTYGSAYGLEVESRKGEGTTVHLRLPVVKGEADDSSCGSGR